MPKLSRQRRHCRKITVITDKQNAVQEKNFQPDLLSEDIQLEPSNLESGQCSENLVSVSNCEPELLNEETSPKPDGSNRKQRVLNLSSEVISEFDLEPQDDTYIIIDFQQMNNLLPNVKCKECNTCSLKFALQSEKSGFVRTIELLCEFCERIGLETVKATTSTSKRLNSKKNALNSN